MIISIPVECTGTPRLLTVTELFRYRACIPEGRNLVCVSCGNRDAFVYASGRAYSELETDASPFCRPGIPVFPVFSYRPEEFPQLVPGTKVEVSAKCGTVIDRGLIISDVPFFLTEHGTDSGAVNHRLKFSREEFRRAPSPASA